MFDFEDYKRRILANFFIEAGDIGREVLMHFWDGDITVKVEKKYNQLKELKNSDNITFESDAKKVSINAKNNGVTKWNSVSISEMHQKAEIIRMKYSLAIINALCNKTKYSFISVYFDDNNNVYYSVISYDEKRDKYMVNIYHYNSETVEIFRDIKYDLAIYDELREIYIWSDNVDHCGSYDNFLDAVTALEENLKKDKGYELTLNS